ncbi:MerR family transcriptional regulator [Streptomyces sp. MBT65]|uniref:MerR family transcriptional regulator n=1 Tax=Streptomyces sp. MBT65 TaxID=1488395 RepID=UPI00190B005E|nr:MerR family transcriptional regulator [Streptomyces sp. MBT65]MBK3575120.1 MerR family transcriptional regulator [Streptomyces sp. MBT65]
MPTPTTEHITEEARTLTAELYNGAQAAELATTWRRMLSANAATVNRSAISNWVTRGHLKPVGLDEQGHPLYTLAGIARAELATRKRALRLVGIGAPSSQNCHTTADDHPALTG